jgi:hypothetical protein
MGYVKIHSQFFDSSINEEEVIVRWVWIALLLSCDRNGNVYGTERALARRANITIEEFQDSLEILMSEDASSSSPDEDGRRIVKTSTNLYHCVNYLKYRGMKDPNEEREKTRKRVAEYRARKKEAAGNADVTKGNDKAEAEAKAEAESKKTASSSSSRGDDKELVGKVLMFWTNEDLRPKVRGISPLRRTAILARKREHSSEKVMEALENRANSRFLCFEIFDGKGASFDWVFGPKNFVKVLDGNYSDGPPRGPRGKTDGQGTDYDATLYR